MVLANTSYSGYVPKLHHFPHPGFSFPTSPGVDCQIDPPLLSASGLPACDAVPTQQPELQEYLKSLGGLAGIVGGISFFLVLTLLVRWCCTGIFCSTRRSNEGGYVEFEDDSSKNRQWSFTRRRRGHYQDAAMLLLISCALMLAIAKGRTSFLVGDDEVGTALTSIEGTLTTATNLATNLQKSSTGLQGCVQQFNIPVCQGTASDCVTVALNDYTSATNNVMQTLDSVGVPTMNAVVEEDSKKYRSDASKIIDASVFCIIFWAIATSACAVSAIMCSNHCLFTCSKVLHEVSMSLLLLYIVLSVTACCVVSVALSDLCYSNPIGVLETFVRDQIKGRIPPSQFANDQAVVNQFLSWYFSCAGSNPLQKPYSDISVGLSNLKQANAKAVASGQLSTAAEQCVNTQIIFVNTATAQFESILGCSTIHTPLTSLVGDAVCTKLVNGFYYSWVLSAAGGGAFVVSFWIISFYESGIFPRSDGGGGMMGAEGQGEAYGYGYGGNMELAPVQAQASGSEA